MGMITLDHKEVGFFTSEHERLAKLFAQHAAIALHNAQLHDTQQKRTRELEALHRATRLLLHSLDVQRVAETFLDICLEAVPTAEKGALMVLDESGGTLRMLACRGYRDERVRTLTLPLNAPSYAAKAVRERQGFVVEDVWADYRIRYRGHIREVGEIRSAVVVPLMSRDEILGVFALDATHPHAFTKADLRLLETFAATAGLVMHNAQLHQQIEHTSRIDPLTGLYNRRGFFYLSADKCFTGNCHDSSRTVAPSYRPCVVQDFSRPITNHGEHWCRCQTGVWWADLIITTHHLGG